MYLDNPVVDDPLPEAESLSLSEALLHGGDYSWSPTKVQLVSIPDDGQDGDSDDPTEVIKIRVANIGAKPTWPTQYLGS